jgi:hypothetical protein
MGRQTNRARRAATAESARARAAALRAEQQRMDRRRKATWYGILGLVVVAAGVGTTLAVTAGGGSSGDTALTDAIRAAGSAGTDQPPWPRPDDTTTRATQAGLAVGKSEGTAVHFHVHLDVFVDGNPTPVPADLGLSPTSISEMHTHDAGGVLHIEAPSSGAWALGQLFDEWNVRLDGSHLGGLTASASKPLAAYVNGKRISTNPAAITLQAHQEIALVYGTAPAKVPSTYQFAAGE